MYYFADTELTVPDVAKVLDCNTTYIYRAIKKQRIKALDTVPTKVRFDEVQNELNDCITDINFGMRDGWSSTHYLSDPTFKEHLFEMYPLENFKKEIDKNLKLSFGYDQS